MDILKHYYDCLDKHIIMKLTEDEHSTINSLKDSILFIIKAPEYHEYVYVGDKLKFILHPNKRYIMSRLLQNSIVDIRQLKLNVKFAQLLLDLPETLRKVCTCNYDRRLKMYIKDLANTLEYYINRSITN